MIRVQFNSKKWLLFILCCLCLPFLFIGIAAAETSESIFVATDRHARYETVTLEEEEDEANTKETTTLTGRKKSKKMPVYDENGALKWYNNLTDILLLVAKDESAVTPDIVLLGGDNVGDGGNGSRDETGYPMGAPAFSIKAVDAQIDYVFGEEVQGIYTYGSHDINETGQYEDSFLSGSFKGNGYWIYGISYAQMIYDTDEQARMKNEKGKVYDGKDMEDQNGLSAQTASHLFLSWVKSLDDHLPIIVMSHVPLHADRGDNSGAWTWTRALNEAAENHDLIFLWGHNHTLEREDEARLIEQAYYLLLPGQTITVQSWDLDDEGEVILKRELPSVGTKAEEDDEPEYELISQEETLRFVYMNAGYITNGTGSLMTFTDVEDDGTWDSLTVKRYLLDAEISDPINEAASQMPLPLRDWNRILNEPNNNLPQ